MGWLRRWFGRRAMPAESAVAPADGGDAPTSGVVSSDVGGGDLVGDVAPAEPGTVEPPEPPTLEVPLNLGEGAFTQAASLYLAAPPAVRDALASLPVEQTQRWLGDAWAVQELPREHAGRVFALSRFQAHVRDVNLRRAYGMPGFPREELFLALEGMRVGIAPEAVRAALVPEPVTSNGGGWEHP
jgi:hypothetical protein